MQLGREAEQDRGPASSPNREALLEQANDQIFEAEEAEQLDEAEEAHPDPPTRGKSMLRSRSFTARFFAGKNKAKK
mgnify:CR=1 FL=1